MEGNVVEKRPKPVSVSKALKEIPVSREALYRKLKRGELPCYKFGKKILVDIDEILAAMRVNGQ
ncbi:helix-turn-helix domain-containing protein [candidate division KSB1 bacterium]|nr:helix-turn-helix domain-containing protein [candidate division KSB1 bacterium]